MSFKEYCEKASDFIESCFDEINNDGLTFDERIKSRIDSLDEEVKEIVLYCMGEF